MTGTGKLLRRQAMKSHYLEKKSAKRKRKFRREQHDVDPLGRPRGQAPARRWEASGRASSDRSRRASGARRCSTQRRATSAPGTPATRSRRSGRALARLRLPRPQAPQARHAPALDHAHQRGRARRGALVQPVRRRLPQGRDRARPQGARRHRGRAIRPPSARSPSRRSRRSAADAAELESGLSEPGGLSARRRSQLYADLCRARGRPRRCGARRAGPGLGRAAAAARRAALPRAGRRGEPGTIRSAEHARVPARVRRRAGRADERGAALAGCSLPLLLRVAAADGCARRSTSSSSGRAPGLNLVWDRYRYRYEAGEWGRRGRAARLRGRGAAARSGRAARADGWTCAGGSGSTARRSTSRPRTARGCCARFVWADQERAAGAARPARSRRFAADPPQLVRGDYVERAARACSRRSRPTG